jgi:IS30 family transposase
MTRKDPPVGAVHSLREIARTLNCSHETVRRRIQGLFSRHPELKRPLLALRSRNGPRRQPRRLVSPLPADD